MNVSNEGASKATELLPIKVFATSFRVALCFLGCLGLQGCNLVTHDVRNWIPEVIGVKKIIYDQHFDETFVIYELTDKSAAEIRDKGLNLLQKHNKPRGEAPSAIAEGFINWRETPMFDSSGKVNAEAVKEAQKYHGGLAQTYPDNFENSWRFNANSKHMDAYLKLISASQKRGSYFTIEKMQECGLLVDPTDKLALLFCMER